MQDRLHQSVQLHIQIGGEFLLAMVERFGVAGWNNWVGDMLDGGHMPLAWSADEEIPPCWWWVDCEGADFSGKILDGADFKPMAWLKNTNFEGASLVGARIGCCPFANFQYADLRGADFTDSDITGADFGDARLDGIKLDGASYDPASPPVGLPAPLLSACLQEPAEDLRGMGSAMCPVPIKASLTLVEMP